MRPQARGIRGQPSRTASRGRARRVPVMTVPEGRGGIGAGPAACLTPAGHPERRNRS